MIFSSNHSVESTFLATSIYQSVKYCYVCITRVFQSVVIRTRSLHVVQIYKVFTNKEFIVVHLHLCALLPSNRLWALTSDIFPYEPLCFIPYYFPVCLQPSCSIAMREYRLETPRLVYENRTSCLSFASPL